MRACWLIGVEVRHFACRLLVAGCWLLLLGALLFTSTSDVRAYTGVIGNLCGVMVGREGRMARSSPAPEPTAVTVVVM